jgi:hypothetical protein
MITRFERVAPTTNAFEFRFESSLLDRLGEIYESVVAPNLDLHTLKRSRAHSKLQRDGLRFDVVPYGNLLAWVAPDDVRTHSEFQWLFDRLGLAAAVQPLVDWHERIVMYQGFYVISDGVAAPTWHVDYYEGAHAYTLLTPLHELDPEHGHLWHLTDGQIKRYEYKEGVGLVIGEGVFHSTQPHPPARRKRVLVSMTFGTDRMAHWSVLSQTVGGQSSFVVMPCGHPRGTCRCEHTQS